MRFGTRALPMVGLRTTLSRLAATTPITSARSLSWVIDGPPGRTDHGQAPGIPSGRDER